MDTIRLEYGTEGLATEPYKFWEPCLKESVLTVHFGKIGTDGQKRTTKFASSEEAETKYRKLVCEKLAKGYKPTAETIIALLMSTAPEPKLEAVCKVVVLETDVEVADDICCWLTACIQHNMPPAQFERTWDKFMEPQHERDLELEEALGEGWSECTSYDLIDFYAKAVKGGADRFVWRDYNDLGDLVACKGDPGARAIEICEVSEENCKDEDGWFVEWPEELGPGAPIASVDDHGARLRDGKRIAVVS